MADATQVGMKMAAQSRMNQQRGPGVKNLGPSAAKKPNPAAQVRGMSPALKGPDKGAGGS